jgi:hypothetical protein
MLTRRWPMSAVLFLNPGSFIAGRCCSILDIWKCRVASGWNSYAGVSCHDISMCSCFPTAKKSCICNHESSLPYFIRCSEDVDLEHDAKKFRFLKQRLAAVVFQPVFISRVQHLPSFKNGNFAETPSFASQIVPPRAHQALFRSTASSVCFFPPVNSNRDSLLMISEC